MAVETKRIQNPSTVGRWIGANLVGWAPYPIAKVFWISFTDYHFISGPNTAVHFVGLQNYLATVQAPIVTASSRPAEPS